MAAKSYMTGQSMGGFLAQIFAVLSYSEGISISAPSALPFLNSHYLQEHDAYVNSGLRFHNIGIRGDKVPAVHASYGHLDNQLETFESGIEPPAYWDIYARFGIHPTHYHEVLLKTYLLQRINSGRAVGFRWQDSPPILQNISDKYLGKTIAIHSRDERFFVSSNQGKLSNSLSRAATRQRGWEKFLVISDCTQDFVYLQDHWGKFLSTSPNGRVSQSKNQDAWEKFKIWEDEIGNIYFQSFHDSWLKIDLLGQVYSEERLNNAAELGIKECN